MAAAGAVTALGASLLALLPASAAQAALTGPSNNATVSGNVAIAESGATNGCNFVHSPAVTSRLEVTRVADGAVVHTANKGGTGALTTTWNSVGQPRGQYRIRSWTRNAVASGFGNLGCTLQAEGERSNIIINLDNKAGVAVTLPSSVVTGEDLAITVNTTVVGNGISGQAAGQRDVTVDVPGVGERQVTTDANGRATLTVGLPDLPAGPLTVGASVATDPIYTGLNGSSATNLTKRTTSTFYRGTARTQPGGTARLVGQLIDATPNSARFGEPVADKTMSLDFGGDLGSGTTASSGKAVRTVQVGGGARTVKVATAFAGDEIYLPSKDGITFTVGDDAAEAAPINYGPVGGITRGLADLLNGLNLSGILSNTVHTTTQTVNGVLGATGMTIDQLIASLGGPQSTQWADSLHLLNDDQLVGVLDGLLATLDDQVGRLGDPVDQVLDGLLRGLTKTPRLGELIETATFDWRSVYVGADGKRQVRQFNALLGVPEPLDVDGDGRSDVLANFKLVKGLTPRLEIARLASAPKELPLSVQAILTLPGSTQQYRFGYDTRKSNAPKAFRADVVLANGGAGLEVASEGDAPLTVTGALVAASTPVDQQPGGGPAQPANLDDDQLDAGDLGPAEQRFGVSFSTAPGAARIGVDLGAGGGGQNLAATLATDEPTRIGLELADDTGTDEVFLAEGVLDSVDGTLAVSLAGNQTDGLKAELTSAHGLDAISLRAQSLAKGRIVSDILLGLDDVPSTISFALGADGTGDLTASGPIGTFQAGYGSNREIALLDDPAYLNLISDSVADTQSIGLRLPGFEGMSLSLGDKIGLDLTMAPTPLRAVVDQDGLQLDAAIVDAPHRLALGLSAQGEIEVRGSAPIDLVTVNARNDAGLFSGATDVDLRLEDVPGLLKVGIDGDKVVFGTDGEPIGKLELFAHSGEPLEVPGSGDGLLLETGPDSIALAGRISGLRGIEASLGSEPDVLLDTVAGNVFAIAMRDVDADGTVVSNVNATLDQLVPNMRLRLVNDGSGAMSLKYSAARATDRLSFDFDGLTGSIGGPLPADLTVCFAGDEACLPTLGIANPDLGSIRFAGSEYTTINLSDPSRGINVQNLRAQVLELTGSLDIDNGGDVYLNTAEFGGDCGWNGCRHPLQGGKINVDLDGTKLLFEPGVGFDAYDALTHMVVTKILGQATGLKGTGGTGQVVCVGATKLDVTVKVIGLPITLSVKDAICNVPNRTPRPANPPQNG